MDTIQILQFGLIALGFIGSLYAAYRIAKSSHPNGKARTTFAPYAVLMIILTSQPRSCAWGELSPGTRLT